MLPMLELMKVFLRRIEGEDLIALDILYGVSRALASGGGLPMLQLRHYIT